MSIATQVAALRAQVKSTLDAGITAGGSAKTYDYFRHVATEAVALSLLKDAGSGRLHFWFVSLADDNPMQNALRGPSHTHSLVTFTLYGYMALKDADATEKLFEAVVCNVLDAFMANKKLGATAINAWPVQWVQAPHVMIANVLCHHARLLVPAQIMVEC